ncbi:MAG: SDR family NAD(P)-dependent oxidoreductase, partial [Verrucomicrobiae bacterium]|nr:SDR family NAD(P)-dependent oxidoreductase [Verrucomicrobiae bacterium]NNJ87015.1 SDR family NAD(P)-dependent oxidoreductase [Akkermansiaceae bacterium]
MTTPEYLSSVFSLENKVAVVIGGTGVLCGAMAEALAAAGAETVLVGRSEEKARERLAVIEAAGGKAYFEKVDVNSKESVQELLNNVLAKSGKVDILINGAGINSPTPIFDIEEEE